MLYFTHIQEYFDINKDGVITLRELGKALEDEKIFPQCVSFVARRAIHSFRTPMSSDGKMTLC